MGAQFLSRSRRSRRIDRNVWRPRHARRRAVRNLSGGLIFRNAQGTAQGADAAGVAPAGEPFSGCATGTSRRRQSRRPHGPRCDLDSPAELVGRARGPDRAGQGPCFGHPGVDRRACRRGPELAGGLPAWSRGGTAGGGLGTWPGHRQRGFGSDLGTGAGTCRGTSRGEPEDSGGEWGSARPVPDPGTPGRAATDPAPGAGRDRRRAPALGRASGRTGTGRGRRHDHGRSRGDHSAPDGIQHPDPRAGRGKRPMQRPASAGPGNRAGLGGRTGRARPDQPGCDGAPRVEHPRADGRGDLRARGRGRVGAGRQR